MRSPAGLAWSSRSGSSSTSAPDRIPPPPRGSTSRCAADRTAAPSRPAARRSGRWNSVQRPGESRAPGFLAAGARGSARAYRGRGRRRAGMAGTPCWPAAAGRERAPARGYRTSGARGRPVARGRAGAASGRSRSCGRSAPATARPRQSASGRTGRRGRRGPRGRDPRGARWRAGFRPPPSPRRAGAGADPLASRLELLPHPRAMHANLQLLPGLDAIVDGGAGGEEVVDRLLEVLELRAVNGPLDLDGDLKGLLVVERIHSHDSPLRADVHRTAQSGTSLRPTTKLELLTSHGTHGAHR